MFSAKQLTMTLTNVRKGYKQPVNSATRRGTALDFTNYTNAENVEKNIREYKDADDRQSR